MSEICILQSKRLWFNRYKRKIKRKTSFWDFDHLSFQVDKLWHQSTRIPVVKTASKLFLIKVLISSYWCVEFSGRSNSWLNLNQMVELGWPAEFKILETISFICRILLIEISRQIISRSQKKIKLYKNAFTSIYGSWNLKFGWPT